MGVATQLACISMMCEQSKRVADLNAADCGCPPSPGTGQGKLRFHSYIKMCTLVKYPRRMKHLLFAVVFLVGSSSGASSPWRPPTYSFSRTPLIGRNQHRIPRSHQQLSRNIAAVPWNIPRGGAMVEVQDNNNNNDDDDGLQAMRRFVKALLNLSGKVSPSASKALRKGIAVLESVFGVVLLPKQKKSKKGKQKNVHVQDSKQSSSSTENEASSRPKKKGKTKSSSPKASAKSIPPKSSSPATKEETTASVGTAKKRSSTKAKTHVQTSLKSTSPNYRIQQELKKFLADPPPNLSVTVGKNLRVWIVTMKGAKGTIYEGETFRLRIGFPPQYPTVPPSVYFLPPNIPVHEHVYTNGDICLSLLGKDWRPTMTAQSIAVSILSILSSAQSKSLPMDNAQHAQRKPGQYQKDWVYHDDNVSFPMPQSGFVTRPIISQSCGLPLVCFGFQC